MQFSAAVKMQRKNNSGVTFPRGDSISSAFLTKFNFKEGSENAPPAFLHIVEKKWPYLS